MPLSGLANTQFCQIPFCFFPLMPLSGLTDIADYAKFLSASFRLCPFPVSQILAYAFFLYVSFSYASFLHVSFRFCPFPFMPLSGLMVIWFLYANFRRPMKSVHGAASAIFSVYLPTGNRTNFVSGNYVRHFTALLLPVSNYRDIIINSLLTRPSDEQKCQNLSRGISTRHTKRSLSLSLSPTPPLSDKLDPKSMQQASSALLLAGVSLARSVDRVSWPDFKVFGVIEKLLTADWLLSAPVPPTAWGIRGECFFICFTAAAAEDLFFFFFF
jgi:hypothetical protein